MPHQVDGWSDMGVVFIDVRHLACFLRRVPQGRWRGTVWGCEINAPPPPPLPFPFLDSTETEFEYSLDLVSFCPPFLFGILHSLLWTVLLRPVEANGHCFHSHFQSFR